jgi:hypothetical protein
MKPCRRNYRTTNRHIYNISLYLVFRLFTPSLLSFLTGSHNKPRTQERLHKRIGIIVFTACFFSRLRHVIFQVIYRFFINQLKTNAQENKSRIRNAFFYFHIFTCTRSKKVVFNYNKEAKNCRW